MSKTDKLFSDFPPQTKADWLSKVAADLKGKSFDELNWSWPNGINLAPFYHPDDQIVAFGPLSGSSTVRNDWEIGEYIPVSSSVIRANRSALKALAGGAEALLFLCSEALNEADLYALLKDIDLSIVSIHFEFQTTETLEESRDKLSTLSWRGSLYAVEAPFSASYLEKESFAEKTSDQAVKTLIFDGRSFYKSATTSPEELAQLLQVARKSFNAIQKSSNLDANILNSRVKLILALDTSYFVSIAKIRALKILWANFIQAYGGDPRQIPEIEIHLAPFAPDSDPNTNRIRTATQTLSAAIGGTDRIFLPPADSGASSPSESSDFSRRIARNVQHLLKMESYIDRVIDPAAGSYYIEKLTDVLAEEAWRKFTALKV